MGGTKRYGRTVQDNLFENDALHTRVKSRVQYRYVTSKTKYPLAKHFIHFLTPALNYSTALNASFEMDKREFRNFGRQFLEFTDINLYFTGFENYEFFRTKKGLNFFVYLNIYK